MKFIVVVNRKKFFMLKYLYIIRYLSESQIKVNYIFGLLYNENIVKNN